MFGELEGRLEELGFLSLEIRPTSLEDVVIALSTINKANPCFQAKSSPIKRLPEFEGELLDCPLDE